MAKLRSLSVILLFAAAGCFGAGALQSISAEPIDAAALPERLPNRLWNAALEFQERRGAVKSRDRRRTQPLLESLPQRSGIRGRPGGFPRRAHAKGPVLSDVLVAAGRGRRHAKISERD